jgi:hypothetical protein
MRGWSFTIITIFLSSIILFVLKDLLVKDQMATREGGSE